MLQLCNTYNFWLPKPYIVICSPVLQNLIQSASNTDLRYNREPHDLLAGRVWARGGMWSTFCVRVWSHCQLVQTCLNQHQQMLVILGLLFVCLLTSCQWGNSEHTINDEPVFSNHTGYIFHDSRRMELGTSTEELDIWFHSSQAWRKTMQYGRLLVLPVVLQYLESSPKPMATHSPGKGFLWVKFSRPVPVPPLTLPTTHAGFSNPWQTLVTSNWSCVDRLGIGAWSRCFLWHWGEGEHVPPLQGVVSSCGAFP